jgi:pimeloyl-ACP methyl ester carboxylesterase
MDTLLDQQLRLADGRRLAYDVYGLASGRPILYCHGFPASRKEPELAGAAAARLGIRIIAPDRPGFGLSDFQPNRTLMDWPADLAALADALKLERFSVLGVSGGGPYALACAAALGSRLISVGIVSGLAPLDHRGASAGMNSLNRLLLLLYRRAPFIASPIYRLLAALAGHRPEWTFTLLTGCLPPPDRAVLRGYPRKILVGSFREALKQGYRGGDRELFIYTRPWGIDLPTISRPVQLWHGERDTTVPVAHGRFLAQAIPCCRSFFLPQEGHFSLPILRMEEILGSLVGDDQWTYPAAAHS